MNSFGVSCFGDAASLVLRLVSVLQRIPKSRHANLAGTGCDRLPPEGSGQVSRCKSCGAGGTGEDRKRFRLGASLLRAWNTD